MQGLPKRIAINKQARWTRHGEHRTDHVFSACLPDAYYFRQPERQLTPQACLSVRMINRGSYGYYSVRIQMGTENNAPYSVLGALAVQSTLEHVDPPTSTNSRCHTLSTAQRRSGALRASPTSWKTWLWAPLFRLVCGPGAGDQRDAETATTHRPRVASMQNTVDGLMHTDTAC